MADDGSMEAFLNDPKTYETTEQENARTLRESKKYKKVKPGDPGVVSVGFDDEGNVKKSPPTTAQRKAMIHALKDN